MASFYGEEEILKGKDPGFFFKVRGNSIGPKKKVKKIITAEFKF